MGCLRCCWCGVACRCALGTVCRRSCWLGVPWDWWLRCAMGPRGVPWPPRGVPWPLYEEYGLELSYYIYSWLMSMSLTLHRNGTRSGFLTRDPTRSLNVVKQILNNCLTAVFTFPARQHCHCPVSHPTAERRLSWPGWLVTAVETVIVVL